MTILKGKKTDKYSVMFSFITTELIKEDLAIKTRPIAPPIVVFATTNINNNRKIHTNIKYRQSINNSKDASVRKRDI